MPDLEPTVCQRPLSPPLTVVIAIHLVTRSLASRYREQPPGTPADDQFATNPGSTNAPCIILA